MLLQDWSLANVIYQGSEEELSDCVIPGTDTVPIVSDSKNQIYFFTKFYIYGLANKLYCVIYKCWQ